MKTEKQLTIAIPAYNAGRYIKKCLASMVDIDKRLEIIVINDGSTDDTEKTVQAFMQKYPDEIRLISKENGGHGSGINVAIQYATGRYFKVVDADDWIIGSNLPLLLDELEKTSTDVIITGYHTINIKNGKSLAYSCQCEYAGKEINMQQLIKVYDDIASCCSFHGLLYRTEFYQGIAVKLSEGVFYEDQEYAILPFAHLNTILILPIFFYQYQIGNDKQSVAFHNQVKRIKDIETVIDNILKYRRDNGPLKAECEEYFLKKLSTVVISYFAICFVKNQNRNEGEEKARQFYQKIHNEAPELLPRISKKYKTLRFFHFLHIKGNLYQAALNTGIYRRFHKLWINS